MRYATVFCLLAIAVIFVSSMPSGVEFTTPKWGEAECEERAAEARKESSRCKDYGCFRGYDNKLIIRGINCTFSNGEFVPFD